MWITTDRVAQNPNWSISRPARHYHYELWPKPSCCEADTQRAADGVSGITIVAGLELLAVAVLDERAPRLGKRPPHGFIRGSPAGLIECTAHTRDGPASAATALIVLANTADELSRASSACVNAASR